MNTVIDLAARSISFITLIQDVFIHINQKKLVDKKHLHEIFSEFQVQERVEAHLRMVIIDQLKEQTIEQITEQTIATYTNFQKRVIELVWISVEEPDIKRSIIYTAKLCCKVAKWICDFHGNIKEDNKNLKNDDVEQGFSELLSSTTLRTPYAWRNAISKVLYKFPCERVKLAQALEYLPIQVILAFGGGKLNARQQRILQLWETSESEKHVFLNELERQVYSKLDTSKAEIYLKDERLLKEELLKESPLSFALIFKDELEEIEKNREFREREKTLSSDGPEEIKKEQEIEDEKIICDIDYGFRDPEDIAREMRLYALAFSGGGIRSATFNLGILQGLAAHNLLYKFDYLSTVSGGGYIGSWLVTWIKRIGSVLKVNNRLNTAKSPDPFGEEVQPIRWLRMFSNYFAPRTGIMSVDSWTVGVTWVRNMLLNLVVILLLLVTLLLFGRFLFVLWNFISWNNSQNVGIYSIWGLLLLLVSLLAGYSMRSYQKRSGASASEKKKVTDKKGILENGINYARLKTTYLDVTSKIISNLIAFITLFGGFLVSAWLYSRSDITVDLLWLPGLFSLLSLLIVAKLGGYDRCIDSYNNAKVAKSINTKGFLWKAWLRLVITAFFAALLGVGVLFMGWKLLEEIKCYCFKVQNKFIDINDQISFTIGMPLMLLAFGVMVVARMALLGKYFPDERREWWGRMGAVVNRLGFTWIIIAASALLGETFLTYYVKDFTGIGTTFGAWAAFVGAGVKLAFNSSSNAESGKRGFKNLIYDNLARIAPYVFILGLLVFLPVLLNPFENYGRIVLDKVLVGYNLVMQWVNEKISAHATTISPLTPENNADRLAVLSFIILVLSITTYRLARRVGVNEFSMHHFNKNRLVRAYLGATRRRTDRIKTANSFTQFDMKDDEKLSSFTSSQGYYGPYPILNTALNVSDNSELDRQDRKAESFIFSPFYCGYDFSMTKASANVHAKSYDYAYRQTKNFAYPNDKGPGIGTAMAISGAAANPNMGYHSSPGTAFLLTVFNVRMGWWIGNPRKRRWQTADPDEGLGYLVLDLIGKSSTKRKFVCLSDGGHFDNMGLYEMVRRRCTYIILGDGEQDDKFICEGLANAIRRCRIDFGVEIEINVDEITKRDENRKSIKHYSVGTIKYPGEEKPSGVLLYIKSSITGDEPVDVKEYSAKNPAFPHQTTADQFFDEEQFESYRKLGLHIVQLALQDQQVIEKFKLGITLPPKPGNVDSPLQVRVNRVINAAKALLRPGK